jgi:hypothetical protein
MGLLDITGPQTVFWSAAQFLEARGAPGYVRHTVSLDGGVVMTTEGIGIDTRPVRDMKGVAIDTIVVPGAYEISAALANPALVAAAEARLPADRAAQPPGWGSTPANLHKVLVIARQHELLIAEDDVLGHFEPGQATRLAALSGLEQVIYFSSFCKVLSPSLRLGWIAADPPLLKALLREKIYSVLTTAALNELVLLEVLAAGRWRKHLDRLHASIAFARNASLRHLRGAGIAFDQPGEAGMFLWGKLPAGVDVDELAADAARNHILLVGGAAFRVGREADPHIRFNVAVCQQPRVADYLRERLQAIEGARGAIRNAGAQVLQLKRPGAADR